MVPSARNVTVRYDSLLDSAPRSTQSGWSAQLRIPHRHPVYFDHPLDHVSGMLTIAALLETVGAPAGWGGPRGCLALDLRFPALGDLGEVTELHADPEGPGARWSLRSSQLGRTTSEGTLSLVEPVRGPRVPLGRTAVGAEAGAGPVPCDPALVHRARTENVLLGELREGAAPGRVEAAVLAPPPGHAFDGPAPGIPSVLGLLESSRQFVTALEHVELNRRPGTVMLWSALRCAVPIQPAAGPYTVRWERVAMRGSRVSFALDLVDAAGAEAGFLTYRVVAVSPSAYRRFRVTAGDGRAA